MKKDGSGVGQRVYPVEYSSMTGNTVPHILNSFIPFDGGEFADICFRRYLFYKLAVMSSPMMSEMTIISSSLSVGNMVSSSSFILFHCLLCVT